ncbi:hypothetical protein DPMN_064631 [Dreissena polymorpha]|uniref:Uncharacterized protein n=1 Tax=Dreissena polymorpha TaxID=45954 RepID=A0A9D4HL76_DREPO|nr:hypothetical protein DPMN_064631 [Dreissena polymorpha]
MDKKGLQKLTMSTLCSGELKNTMCVRRPTDVIAIGNSWKNFTLGGGVCRRVRYKENLYCLAI